MLTGLYIPGDSLLHRLSPARKILGLIVFSSAAFFITDLWVLGGVFCGVILSYLYAGISSHTLMDQLKPAFWILLVIFCVLYWTENPYIASLNTGRFATLILGASLVTLTTKSSEMIEGIEKLLRPFHKILPVERISLSIALCLRFIPSIQVISREIREAQAARGLTGNIFAIAVPLIIRVLKMADEISEAIYARGFETEVYDPYKD
ncbi:MAG: energy-coupling factor transporter transmembrane protein EcfT [Alphaproteobacteria bacterium]|nr:energy-coupling factor transporter transmembrane protein EcfT [Alphaproteobacteria bacterium]